MCVCLRYLRIISIQRTEHGVVRMLHSYFISKSLSSWCFLRFGDNFHSKVVFKTLKRRPFVDCLSIFGIAEKNLQRPQRHCACVPGVLRSHIYSRRETGSLHDASIESYCRKSYTNGIFGRNIIKIACPQGLSKCSKLLFFEQNFFFKSL